MKEKTFWIILDQDNEPVCVTDKMDKKTESNLEYLNCEVWKVDFLDFITLKKEYQELYNNMGGE